MSIPLNDILEIVQEISAFKPIIKNAINGLKEYKEEYEEVTDFIRQEIIKSRIETFKGFVENGFSREEAMVLTLASIKDFNNELKNLNNKGVK